MRIEDEDKILLILDLMTNVMKTNSRNIFRITNVTDWKTKVTWKTLFVQ